MLPFSLTSPGVLGLGGFMGFCSERMAGGFEGGASRIRTDVMVLGFHSRRSRYMVRQGVATKTPSGLVSTWTVVEFVLLVMSGAGHILVVGASHGWQVRMGGTSLIEQTE